MKSSVSMLFWGLAICIAVFIITPIALAADHPVASKKYVASAVELAALDGFALGLVEAERFSGVVLVASEGKVIFEKAYGLIDAEEEAVVDTGTRFNLASAGKMFTSTAVLQQIARGKLTLDTTVGEVLADYPNKEFAAKVTVRHLLIHTSGAGDIDLFGLENARNRTSARSVAQMLALHHDRAPAFEPGAQQEYGNFSFVVLGRMVEVLSGKDFESYLKQHVFEPAGMTRTGFADCTDPAADIAAGYAQVNDKSLRNCETLPARGFPAGGQVSTAADMLRFVESLRSGALVSAPLFADAIRPHHEFMGLGFFATGYGPGYTSREFRWGHGGSADGICTDVRTYPETAETIIVLSNKDIPGCFAIANFLHRQWDLKARND